MFIDADTSAQKGQTPGQGWPEHANELGRV